ncbi:MAG: hypothetical protein LBT31_00975 [Synergistaceae bacterium]|nr:hypothetical protein [Synergistaceae bacterium]
MAETEVKKGAETANEETSVERRLKKDWMTKSITVFTGIGWGLTIAMVIIFSNASPEKENFFTRIFNIEISGYWNERMLYFTLNALVAAFFCCLLGIVFNMMRHRRKTDHMKKPLVILSLLSFVGIIAFLAYFADYF